MASVVAVCISEKKGTVKISVPEIFVKENCGVDGDAHFGESHRQVSLLAVESVDKMRDKIPTLKHGDFAENIVTRGICLYEIPVGTRIKIGTALLEVTQIGKDCHNEGCAIKRQTGECVMPREGIFVSVLQGGTIKPGDEIVVSE